MSFSPNKLNRHTLQGTRLSLVYEWDALRRHVRNCNRRLRHAAQRELRDIEARLDNLDRYDSIFVERRLAR